MKLLYFTLNIHALGGYSRIVIDKINWLADHGYEVTICDILRTDIVPAYPLDNRVRTIRGDIVGTSGNLWHKFKEMFLAYKRMKNVIQEVSPDVIINAHSPRVTWMLLFVTNIPKIVEIHLSRIAIEGYGDKSAVSKNISYVYKFIRKWIYSKYDKFVVLTHEDEKAWGMKNCITIPNFTNMSTKETMPSSLMSNKIITTARLVVQKRLDLMIEVWGLLSKRYPDWSVDVYGDGPERSKLHALIDQKGIGQSFHLLGSTMDVKEKLQQSSIFCFTSEYEGFGIVIIEAMQMGLPVVSFEYSGIHDIIKNGENGIIIPFGDVDAFAEALASLMDSKEKMFAIRNNALRSVLKFEKTSVMNSWDQLFKTLIKSENN